MEFSVVIPTFERVACLARCLAALEGQEFSGGFEVLVVDDGSRSDYSGLQRQFDRVRWLRQQRSGPGEARNLGVSHARGRFIAFVDDDCEPCPGWLESLRVTLESQPECLVGGSTVVADPSNPYDIAAQSVQAMAYRHFNSTQGEAVFFASNNLALAKETFQRLGGFAPQYAGLAAEDRDLCSRARHHGHPLFWQRTAVVKHRPGLNLYRYCSMFFRYGRGAAVFQCHRACGSFLRDSRFHLSLPSLVLREIRSLPRGQGAGVLALFVLWQLFNALGFLYQVTRPRTVKIQEQERPGGRYRRDVDRPLPSVPLRCRK